MVKKNWGILWGLAFVFLFVFTLPVYGANEVPRISVTQLNEIMGSSNLVILDVRTERDWKNSDRKVVGAIRVDPRNINSWAGDYNKEQQIVLYCA